MKRFFSMMLALLLLAGCAEGLAAEGVPAVLRLSSFDGGGPEYSVTFDDPEIAACTWERQYHNPDHDMMTGSAYEVVCTIVGLKPGTTGMTLSARSPIAENYDAFYTVTVDDGLNVQLCQARAISRFELSRTASINYNAYEIITLQDEYYISVNGGDYRKIDSEPVDALCALFEEYDLSRWDGFNKMQSGVLDGEGFRLVIELTDGTSVHAYGSNSFPENYFDVIGQMQDILDGIEPEPAGAANALLAFLSGLFSGKGELVVGTDVALEDITEFWYTYDSSTNPPAFQRYRFFVEDGERLFHHETRSGDHWPLTEEDITVSGTMELSEAQWSAFLDLLKDGTVKEREESLEDGNAGPWLYLYWKGDRSVCQEYSFASWDRESSFEDFCVALKDLP